MNRTDSNLVCAMATRRLATGAFAIREAPSVGLLHGWCSRLAAMLALGVGLALVQGCASTEMKGTPFYTGEYSVRRGPAEDRVNIWPLLYYREPALSVLWPFIEHTDDHFAVRPLWSVYGLDTDRRVYNALWPLGRFDPIGQDYRFFPFFWGDDYGCAFPLFWHLDDPFGADGGYSALFPLWSHRRCSDGGYSTHLAWPFFHIKDMRHARGWRLWPLYGQYARHGDRYRFALWPLGHQWENGTGDEGGDCVLPVYYRDHDATRRRFFSLLYGSGETTADDTAWQLALPLWYARRDGDERLLATLLGGYKRSGDDTTWMVAPLLSGGRYSDDDGTFWGLGPMAHVAWDEAGARHHVFPFYYRERTSERSRFYSLLWSHDSREDGSGWQMAAPLFFRMWDTNSSAFVTPLYARGRSADGDAWQGVFPFVYKRSGADDRLLATPLGGYRKDADSTDWLFLPLAAGGRHDATESSVWALAPLLHIAWGEDGRREHLLPLYYRNTRSGTVITPLVARLTRGERRTTMAPLALSWHTAAPDRSDLWLVGPLAHFSWGERPGSSHVFPLFYADREDELFVSLLYGRMRDGDRTVTVLPPLLSLYARDGTTRDLYAALGLFHARWGRGAPASGHCFPLYAFEEDAFLYTLLYGRKTGPDGHLYPLTPLAGFYTGDNAGGWLFPFWSRKRHKATGHVSGTVLWGSYWRRGKEACRDLFPLFNYRRHPPIGDATAGGSEVGEFGWRYWIFPCFWSGDMLRVCPDHEARKAGIPGAVRRYRERKFGVFPLWGYHATAQMEAGVADTRGSVLLFLYDYQKRVRPPADGGTAEYTRARILWRLWHYERVDGDVSVDIFPAITYDAKADGFRKVSFLWRLFRYERRGADTKLDLLFLPLMR